MNACWLLTASYLLVIYTFLYFLQLRSLLLTGVECYLSPPSKDWSAPLLLLHYQCLIYLITFLTNVEFPNLSQNLGLYHRFVSSPNFSGWLERRRIDANSRLRAAHIQHLLSTPLTKSDFVGRSQVEVSAKKRGLNFIDKWNKAPILAYFFTHFCFTFLKRCFNARKNFLDVLENANRKDTKRG